MPKARRYTEKRFVMLTPAHQTAILQKRATMNLPNIHTQGAARQSQHRQRSD